VLVAGLLVVVWAVINLVVGLAVNFGHPVRAPREDPPGLARALVRGVAFIPSPRRGGMVRYDR
jgi:hypothetical protein